MRDDELLVIYGATRQLAEDMQARDAELKQSTAALEATIAQVRPLPAMLGQQTSKYIAAGVREVVQEDFRQPIEKAVEGPIRSIEVTAYHARAAVEQINQESPFPKLDRVRPHPGSGHGFGGRGGLLLLCPAGGGVEQTVSTTCSIFSLRPLPAAAGHPRPAAEVRPEEAWAALKAGYGFDAQALGTRIQPASHKFTASAARYT